MSLEKSDHHRLYEALELLGTSCPVCNSRASTTEVVPIGGEIEGSIECGKCERKYKMKYIEEDKKWVKLEDY